MRRTSGVSMKPDSSRKTSVAPRRAAFFLDGGTRPSARSRSRLPSARAPWSPASVPSTRVDERGSSERGRRGTRLRRSARSEPSLWDTSIGRSASRVLLRLSKEARRARSLVQQKECVGAPGGASAPSPSYLSCPNPSPTGSPTPDCNPPFSPLRFVNGPPSPELLLDVCAFPAPLHFLRVSWRGSVAQTTALFNRKAGINKTWYLAASISIPETILNSAVDHPGLDRALTPGRAVAGDGRHRKDS